MASNPSALYPGQIDTSDPTGYPLGKARNITVAGDGTGTPWEAAIVNDIFGFQQELLSKAGIVVAGVGTPDKVGASEYFDAMRATCGYPGMIQPLALNVDPSTLGIRMLIMDGSGILVANYSDLVTATYIGDPDNPTADSFYRADDAAGTARNTSGAYFILPDTRGQFLRGLDSTGTVDPQGASRVIGDLQPDRIIEHGHLFTSPNKASFLSIEWPNTSDNVDSFLTNSGTAFYVDEVEGVSTTSETRPTNMAVNWGIWY